MKAKLKKQTTPLFPLSLPPAPNLKQYVLNKIFVEEL